jgi:hypothetical protein
VVIGPFLIAVGIARFMHHRDATSWRQIVPLMQVVIGELMLVARSPRVPDRGRRDEA